MVQIENDFIVSEEKFAAWLDGTLSPEEEIAFNEACSVNPKLLELLDVNDCVDESFEEMVETGFELPNEFLSDFEVPLFGNLENYDFSSDEYQEFDEAVCEEDHVSEFDENNEEQHDFTEDHFWDLGV